MAAKAKSLMNKISRETFDKLSEEFLQLPISSQNMLERVIDVVFDKALEDVFFQDLYADLCKKLAERASDWSKRYLIVSHIGEKESPAGAGWYFDTSGNPSERQWQGPAATEEEAIDTGRKACHFKRILLNRCESEFKREDLYKPILLEQETDEYIKAEAAEQGKVLTEAEEKDLHIRALIREEKRYRIKQRMLANISFIGHLYKVGGMLNEPIMYFCVQKLIGDHNKPDPEQIEALCKLLTTIGPKFQVEELKLSSTPRFEAYCTFLQNLARNLTLPSRIRFMCMDFIELKNGKWIPRGSQASLERTTLTLTREELRKREEEKANQKPTSGGGGSQDVRKTGGQSYAQLPPNRSGPGNAAKYTPAATPAAAAGKITGSYGGGKGPATFRPKPTGEGSASPSPGPSKAAEETYVRRPSPMSPDALAKRSITTLTEFSELNSEEELERSVKDMQGTENYGMMLVYTALTKAGTHRTPKIRLDTSKAFLHLISKGLLKVEDVLAALQKFAPVYVDLFLDAPKLYSYVVEILGGLIAQYMIPVDAMLSFSRNIAKSNSGANLMASYMNAIMAGESEEGKAAVSAAISSRKINLATFVTPSPPIAYSRLAKELGADLTELYPEILKLGQSFNTIESIVTGSGSPEDEDAVKDAFASLPDVAKAPFANGIVISAVVAAEESGGDADESSFMGSIDKAGVLLCAAVGHGETSPGYNHIKLGGDILFTISSFYTGSDVLPPEAMSRAIKALSTPVSATGSPVLKKEAFTAWVPTAPQVIKDHVEAIISSL